MNNLKAEMARYGIGQSDVQLVLGCSEKTIRNKLSGETQFSFPEARMIRDALFPGLKLEYLFADAETKTPPNKNVS